MKFFDTVFEKIGIRTTEEDYEEREEPEVRTTPQANPAAGRYTRTEAHSTSNVVDFRSARDALTAAKLNFVVFEPKNYNDVQKIADYLKNKSPVLINFEATAPADRQRIVDFVSGSVSVLEGKMREVGRNVILCAPPHVDINDFQQKK